jgi:hypothetical protein
LNNDSIKLLPIFTLFWTRFLKRLGCFESNKLFSLRKRSNFFFYRSEFAKVKNFETPSTEFWREETHRWSSELQHGGTKNPITINLNFKQLIYFYRFVTFKCWISLQCFNHIIFLLMNDQQGRTNTRGNDRRSKLKYFIFLFRPIKEIFLYRMSKFNI